MSPDVPVPVSKMSRSPSVSKSKKSIDPSLVAPNVSWLTSNFNSPPTSLALLYKKDFKPSDWSKPVITKSMSWSLSKSPKSNDEFVNDAIWSE